MTLILITGAAGKTGKAVIRAAARRGAMTRDLVRGPAQADVVRHLGARDVVVGDMLCGPEVPTQHQITGILTRVLGRPVRAKALLPHPSP